MLLIAWKMLAGDRAKYLGIVLALGFTTLLVAQQGATMLHILSRTTVFIDSIGGVDMWVTDSHAQYVDDIKALSDIQVQRVRSIPGIAWAVPMYRGSIRARMPDGNYQNCQFIGVDDATLIGRPAEMLQGRFEDLRIADSILVDIDAAGDRLAHVEPDGTRRPLRVGDTLELNDHLARVVGIYRGEPNFQSQPVIYTTYERAKSFVPSERKLLSFILAGLQPGTDVARVQDDLFRSAGLRGRTTGQFSRESLWWFIRNTGILVSFGLSTLLAFLIGGGIAGQTFANFMLDNQRHFAVLRAMGAPTRTLVGMVVLQALAVTLIGYGLGTGGVALLAILGPKTGPQVELSWPLLGATAFAVVFVGAAAGTLGLRRVLRLDPAEVFK
ncbi:ABC transporter permease [Rhodovastum atsumiense]|uniref:ABC transporter permease n=1 Tax=Rhodovastum atsumiense TaxID=504468 RepID=A0A5M6IYJ1_9PROT|nr:ABC transporter permease [Rhodovastum atsumiense]KAA5613416.1 ABC transporter permease [Rhodovastum atsumiense]CAH2603141.1 ABC transporter permease [Rhodovastum atsumiense]